MASRTSQALHVVSIVLGGVATALVFLGYPMAAGVTTIAIVTVNTVGVYVANPT